MSIENLYLFRKGLPQRYMYGGPNESLNDIIANTIRAKIW